MAAHLYGHTVGHILRLVVFRVADAETEEHLRSRVYHFIHACCTHIAVFVTVVQVQFRTVTVPQGVTHRRKLGLVPAVEFLVCAHLAVNGIMPQWLYGGTVKPGLHSCHAF